MNPEPEQNTHQDHTSIIHQAIKDNIEYTIMKRFVTSLYLINIYFFKPFQSEALSTQKFPQRRDIFSMTSNKILSSFVVEQLLMTPPLPSNAACLPSDTSISCIGVYKVPIDDAISGYVNTPENFMKIAPGVKWVPPTEYPKSVKEALQEMRQLRQDLDSVIIFIKEGNLTSAGVEILRMVPRITVDGRVIINTLKRDESTSMKAYRVENAHNELLASLGGVDVLLGQALNGQMGSITMAQIQCLEELNGAIQSFDDLIKAIPPSLS